MRVLRSNEAYTCALYSLDMCMCLSVNCQCNESKSGLKRATMPRADSRVQRFKCNDSNITLKKVQRFECIDGNSDLRSGLREVARACRIAQEHRTQLARTLTRAFSEDRLRKNNMREDSAQQFKLQDSKHTRHGAYQGAVAIHHWGQNSVALARLEEARNNPDEMMRLKEYVEVELPRLKLDARRSADTDHIHENFKVCACVAAWLRFWKERDEGELRYLDWMICEVQICRM